MTVEREVWDKPIELVLSLIGCAVGFGNVWRYPYIAYQNGGGAFIIPYFTMYLLLGLPIYYYELCLGQFASIGVSKVYRFSRMWTGLGWTVALGSFVASIYYNMIIAWVIFYFFSSFRKRLLWTSCDNAWNTPMCRAMDQIESNTTRICQEQLSNSTTIDLKNCTTGKLAAEEYFQRYVLEQSDSFENFGVPKWKLSLCLLFSWILVYLCIRKGIQSSGKVVYVTALFPYVVLFALIIRGVTLSGSSNGLRFYFLPDWKKMKDLNVWMEATIQVLYSLGIASGVVLNYSSFSKFKHNILRDCLIAVLFDCFTSIMAGIAIFSVLGFLANKFNLPIDSVVQSGPGLAFIAYPEAMARMPLPQLWSILFFLMMITLGLDSQFAMTDVAIATVLDTVPRLRTYKSYVIMLFCILCYLLGLPLCAPGGIYYFTLINEYSANLSTSLACFLEIVIVVYIYGFDNFMNDIAMMLGHRPFEPYIFLTWCVTTPLISLIVFLTMVWGFKSPVVGDYVFPAWANSLGLAITFAGVSPIVIVGVYQYIKSWRATENHDIDSPSPHYLRALRHCLAPSHKWGPALPENRTGRYANNRLSVRPDSITTLF